MTVKTLSIGAVTQDIFLLGEHLDNTVEAINSDETAYIFPLGDKIMIDKTVQSYGGSAHNSAMMFHKQGFDSYILSHLGDDMVGNNILQHLQKHSIHTDYIFIEEKKESSISCIIMNNNGERTVLHYKNTPLDIPIIALPLVPDAIYLGHISELELDNVYQYIASVVSEHNTKLYWNPGNSQFHNMPDHYHNLFKMVDTVFLNATELSLWYKKQIVEEPFRTVDMQNITAYRVPKTIRYAKEYADKLLLLGAKRVIITDGENGAQYYDSDNNAYFIASDPDKECISTLGAGDAFASGFISSLIKSDDVRDSLLYANKNSASVLRYYDAYEGLLEDKKEVL